MSLGNIILWDHYHMYSQLLTKMSLYDTWPYFTFSHLVNNVTLFSKVVRIIYICTSSLGFFCFFFFFLLLLCWVGVHCGIYKSSYNISNVSHLNSPLPLSFILLPRTSSLWKYILHHILNNVFIVNFYITFLLRHKIEREEGTKL
jgi:uncharacterized membrane protein